MTNIEIDVDELWEPILEGIVAYAAYTQDMDKSRSKYFSTRHLERWMQNFIWKSFWMITLII
jgi:hypothetical protein